MTFTRRTRHLGAVGALAAGLAVVVGLSGCSSTGGSGGSSAESNKTQGVTIQVAWTNSPPPAASLAAFTKKTGITVKWSNIDWDSLQTKISAAAASKTYFADVTDVDWSRVGQLAKLGWFIPMNQYMDIAKLKADMPQLTSFEIDGKAIGIPFDSSYMVTTVNTKMFAKAGITTMPTTIDEYTKDLKQVKAKGVSATPLNIPFAAAEGLSTYWYQTTGAFGGTVLNGQGEPQFTSPDSAGYKAAEWMINAYKDGLVPKGNINANDSQGQQKLMAKGVVASTFSDYSGNVGSLYNVPSSSSVVNDVKYIPTPGATGAGPNLSNPDGIGIPKEAKHPAAAAKFIEWVTATQNQADFAGASGSAKVMPNYPTPSRLSALAILQQKGELAQGDVMSSLLKDSSAPVFPEGAPSWYPEFSNAVYTNLHAAAVGSKSVAAAIASIAKTANSLAAKK